MTNYIGLKHAIEVADSRFRLIKEKYPDLEMYLVFSSNLGQTNIRSTFETIVGEFPFMIEDSAMKAAAINTHLQIRELEDAFREDETLKSSPKVKQRMAALKNTLASYADKVSYNDDVNIEIRFKTLNFDLIRKIKGDDMIDHKLTSPSDASIAVVMGNLDALSHC